MFRVIQISDPHIVVPPEKVSGRIESLPLLQRVIARIKQVLPKVGPVDALLVTGDITERGDRGSYQAFLDTVGELGLPVYAIPGNHDGREAMRSAFADHAYIPQSGRLNWCVDVNGVRMIGLDTLVEGQGGGVVDEVTLRFLETHLEAAGVSPVLLALHHPPFSCGIKFMDSIGLAGTKSLAQLLENSAADIQVVCGHVHTAIIAKVGGVVAMSAPSTCSTFDVNFRADAPVGFTTQPGGFVLHSWNDGFRSMQIGAEFGSGPHPF